jgi:phosphoribosylaminoimidazolecarboxamide formyltransferase/IMP cyclohydrolase
MTDTVPPRRALISVSDKTGLIEFATALAGHGVELLSTGGTAKALRDAGLPVRDVAEVTGFPEMMDGRVKTLHPMVHGGLLALRDHPDHLAAMETHKIGAIDLLVVNLYPFEATVASGAAYDDCIENIDIGGPAMIRAAAKNHAFVGVVVDTEDYAEVLAQIAEHGGTTLSFRQRLARTAYARTAAYDAAVSTWMAAAHGDATPRRRAFAGVLKQTMRYGENPHQQAAFYTDGSGRPGVATARQHQGKELSYNNINDTDAAFELVAEFAPAEGPACAIIKHANPCGVARGATLLDAYRKAFDCDRTSAFGGIVALNQRLDAATAEEIVKIFTEVVIAPEADDDAIAIFAAKKNLRLLTTGALPDPRQPVLGLQTGRRRASGAGQGHGPCPRNRSARGHETRAQRRRNGRSALCLDRGKACEIQRHRLCPRRRDRGRRRGPDEPGGQLHHRSAESGPHGGRTGPARDPRQGRGRRLRRLLSLRRWAHGRRRGRGDRHHPARRLGARRRGDRGRRCGRPRHGLHRHAPFPALTFGRVRLQAHLR